MNNKKLFKTLSIIVLTAVIISVAAQNGFCTEDIANQVPALAEDAVKAEKHDTIVKFVVAMIGVVVSSIVLFVGLSIYNKYFVNKRLYANYDPNDILNTPQTVDEAVNFFIKRNKLC